MAGVVACYDSPALSSHVQAVWINIHRMRGWRQAQLPNRTDTKQRRDTGENEHTPLLTVDELSAKPLDVLRRRANYGHSFLLTVRGIAEEYISKAQSLVGESYCVF
jgi:hypothetical protein